jgi:hypothetical protein
MNLAFIVASIIVGMFLNSLLNIRRRHLLHLLTEQVEAYRGMLEKTRGELELAARALHSQGRLVIGNNGAAYEPLNFADMPDNAPDAEKERQRSNTRERAASRATLASGQYKSDEPPPVIPDSIVEIEHEIDNERRHTFDDPTLVPEPTIRELTGIV